ncbi:MAG: hypothetical protein ACRELB_11845 [Polyangiaceae bacterium]
MCAARSFVRSGLRIAAGLVVIALASPARAQTAPDAPHPHSAQPGTPAPTASPGEIDHLVAQLGSTSYTEREAATERLRKLGKAAFPALQAALASPDAEVRYRARLLLRARIRRVATLLQHIIQPTGGSGEQDSWRQLTGMGDDAVEPLVQILRRNLAQPAGGDGDNMVRAAMGALTAIAAEKSSVVAFEGMLSLFDMNLRGMEASIAAPLKSWSEGRARVGRLVAGGSTPLARENAVNVLGLMGD